MSNLKDKAGETRKVVINASKNWVETEARSQFVNRTMADLVVVGILLIGGLLLSGIADEKISTARAVIGLGITALGVVKAIFWYKRCSRICKRTWELVDNQSVTAANGANEPVDFKACFVQACGEKR